MTDGLRTNAIGGHHTPTVLGHLPRHLSIGFSKPRTCRLQLTFWNSTDQTKINGWFWTRTHAGAEKNGLVNFVHESSTDRKFITFFALILSGGSICRK